MKILTLILDDYQDIELNAFLGTLNMSGQFEKIDFYNPHGMKPVFGSNNFGSITPTVSNPNIDDYIALYIPGGQMAMALRDDKKSLDFIREFEKKNKFVIAHCDSPNALWKNKIFADKKYVSYPIEDIESNSSEKRVTNGSLSEVDGKYITGRGPAASFSLALKTISTLISEEASEVTWNRILGKE
ncbi:MAG: DJ-1/PfpI family protein [Metamycoplasmataceae bacterium]